MHKWFVFFLIAPGIILGGSCKSTTGPDEEGLKGTWKATKAEFTSVANPTTKADVVALGGTVTLALNASTAVLTITKSGQNPQTYNATWSASIDTLTLTWTSGASGNSQFDYSLNGDHLTLEGGHMPFDFTVGNFEEAILEMNLTRQ
jgi:hypothetical protein